VAKEYIAAQPPEDPGVLILSQFAGAAEELSEAIVINPHDADTIAEALHKALVMPLEERRERYEALYAKVVRTSAKAYCDRFLGALQAMPGQGAAVAEASGARLARAMGPLAPL
jgi:trehalose 6-phosphate synthase